MTEDELRRIHAIENDILYLRDRVGYLEERLQAKASHAASDPSPEHGEVVQITAECLKPLLDLARPRESFHSREVRLHRAADEAEKNKP